MDYRISCICFLHQWMTSWPNGTINIDIDSIVCIETAVEKEECQKIVRQSAHKATECAIHIILQVLGLCVRSAQTFLRKIFLAMSRLRSHLGTQLQAGQKTSLLCIWDRVYIEAKGDGHLVHKRHLVYAKYYCTCALNQAQCAKIQKELGRRVLHGLEV